MVEYTTANYVLLGATVVVFTAMFIGCVILVAKETTRQRRKRKYKKELNLNPRAATRPSREFEGLDESNVGSPGVSLKGINEWHILPPINNNFRNYASESTSFGYRNTTEA